MVIIIIKKKVNFSSMQVNKSGRMAPAKGDRTNKLGSVSIRINVHSGCCFPANGREQFNPLPLFYLKLLLIQNYSIKH